MECRIRNVLFVKKILPLTGYTIFTEFYCTIVEITFKFTDVV